MELFNYQEWMLDVFSEAMETSYALIAPLRLFRLFYRGTWKHIKGHTLAVC